MRKIGAAVILALLSGACGRAAGFEGSEPMAVPLKGEVQVQRGERFHALTEATEVAPGDVIRTGDDGQARLDISRNQRIELAPSSALRVGEDQHHRLLQGNLLAEVGRAIAIDANGMAQVLGSRSVFRVDLGLSTRVAVYRGEVRIPGSGLEEPVKQFREVRVPVFRPQQPLDVGAPDHWDVRYLGDAISIGETLMRHQRAMAQQIPSRGNRSVLLDLFPKGLPKGQLRELMASGIRPTELLVAAVVATLVAGQGDDSLQVLRDLLVRIDEGASWVLIVAEWGLGKPVLAALSEISGLLAEILLPAVAPPSSGEGSAPVGDSPGTGVGPGDTSGGGSTPTGGGTTSPPAGGGPIVSPPSGGGNNNGGGGGPQPPPDQPEEPSNPGPGPQPECDLVCQVIDNSPLPGADAPVSLPVA